MQSLFLFTKIIKTISNVRLKANKSNTFQEIVDLKIFLGKIIF